LYTSKVLKKSEPFILGKCQCGCEELVPFGKTCHGVLGRFKHGHNSRSIRHSNCRAAGTKDKGYIKVYKPEHYFNNHGCVLEHRNIIVK
jgi:hypothetical protein